MAKPRTVISIVAMTVARRSAAIFEQLRLLVTANFVRILSSCSSDRNPRTHLFLWAITGRETGRKATLGVRPPGLDRTQQAPRTAETSELEGWGRSE